jgi:hypothetical protein
MSSISSIGNPAEKESSSFVQNLIGQDLRIQDS